MRIPVFSIFPFLMSLGFLVLFLWSTVWVYKDAENRGKSGCLVALLTALISWPLGLLLWLVVRPELNWTEKKKKKNDDLFEDMQ